MENFLELELPCYKLEQLNMCGMYLQVTILAEIMDHTSLTLLPQILSNTTNPVPKGLNNISKSMLQWQHVALSSPTC